MAAVLIHELGHMGGGLVSGYSFMSLTILGVRFSKDGKRFGIGVEKSLGNCQMYSERLAADPSLLILGGCMANLFAAACLMTVSALMLFFGGSLVTVGILILISGSNFTAGMYNLFRGSAYSDGAAYKEVKASKTNAGRYNLLMLLENGRDIKGYINEIGALGLFEDNDGPSSLKDELFEWQRSLCNACEIS